MELLLNGPPSPFRLPLEGAERRQVALSIDDLFHGGRAERSDQLILQVRDADVETESFHLVATEVGAETRLLETAPEVALLADVAQARQPYVQTCRAEDLQEGSDIRRTPHRDDRDAVGVEIPTAPDRQRLQRELIADPFNQDDGTGGHRGKEITTVANDGTSHRYAIPRS